MKDPKNQQRQNTRPLLNKTLKSHSLVELIDDSPNAPEQMTQRSNYCKLNYLATYITGKISIRICLHYENSCHFASWVLRYDTIQVMTFNLFADGHTYHSAFLPTLPIRLY